MDLSILKTSKADVGAVLKLKHPSTDEVLKDEKTGEPLTITLLGSDSKKYQAFQRAKQQAALNRISRGRNTQKLDAEKLADESLNELCEMTIAWTCLELAGESLECNADNARKIYTEFAWIREQAQEFLADRGNFI